MNNYLDFAVLIFFAVPCFAWWLNVAIKQIKIAFGLGKVSDGQQ